MRLLPRLRGPFWRPGYPRQLRLLIDVNAEGPWFLPFHMSNCVEERVFTHTQKEKTSEGAVLE